MPRPSLPQNIFEFQQQFSTEEACLDYLLHSRWPDGFVCPRCGNEDFYWIPTRKLLDCKFCRKQTSVTSGTVMHRSKMPLRVWFYAAYLVTTHTPGMSAVQFQRQTGLSNYETAFMMLHKLRAAMVKIDRSKLHGTIEIDEAYVGGKKSGKPGRGAAGKVIVVGAVEVRDDKVQRVRLEVVPDVKRATLKKFIEKNVEKGSAIKTDALPSYGELDDYVHTPMLEGTPENAGNILPHVHRLFSNLKTWLIGTHHGVSQQHLQAYLNEYVFRFNRRRTPMAAFQTVLGLIAERRGPTYEGIYGVQKGSGEWEHPNPLDVVGSGAFRS